MNVGVVIAAAGKGTRMQKGYNKQFILIREKPLIAHTLQVFERMPAIGRIVVVTGRADIAKLEDLCRTYALDKVTDIVSGGKSRQESVYRGLCVLDREEWVLVHDGARPFVSERAITRLLHTVRDCGAAVLGVPVKDTIKQVAASGAVEETPDRDRLWAIQTPQAFRLSALKQAHERARREKRQATDDAALMEHMGWGVHVVRGTDDNIKITTPTDLALAEAILKMRESK